jgi:uncharacterized metal-binding protein
MNFLDAFIDEKIRTCYLKIIKLDDCKIKHPNKNVQYANLRDKIRLFEIVIQIKKKHELDFSDDVKRKTALIEEAKKCRS